MMESTVYFIAAPGRIKIGYTRKPEKRLQQLRLNDMEPIDVLGTINGSRQLEQAIHNLVRAHCIRGEWFADCEQVRGVIADAMAGKIADPKTHAPATKDSAPVATFTEEAKADLLTSILKAAVAESERICDEMVRLSWTREKNPEHIKQIEFLTEKIIAPILNRYRN